MRRVGVLALVVALVGAVGVVRRPAPAAAAGPHTQWLFGEGTTRPGFDEYLVLANPGPASTHVDVSFLMASGTHAPVGVDVAPLQRQTLAVHDIVGRGQDLGLSVVSSGEVLAERVMYFAYGPAGWDGASATAGAADARTLWSFGEGTTRPGFESYLTVSNPGNTAVTGTVTFLVSGAAPVSSSVGVAARSRSTVIIHQIVPANLDFGIRINTSGPVVAERAEYFNYHGTITGGSAVLGAAPDTHFIFAEGSTRAGFDPYILIANPLTNTTASVVLRYLPDGKPDFQESLTVTPNSRVTVNVRDKVPPDTDLGFDVISSSPVIAERAEYALYHGMFDGGHAVVGAADGATTWGFGEGTTRLGFDQYITISNATGANPTATVTFLPASGPIVQRDIRLAPQSRATVSLVDVLGRGVDAGIRVDATSPVVAERVSYHNYQGLLGAHGAMGTPGLTSPKPNAPPPGPGGPPVNITVDPIIPSGFSHVWSLAFASDGRIFFSERTTGIIRVFTVGSPPVQIIDLPSCNCGEGGLMGLALSPNFAVDGFLYAMYTFSGAPTPTGFANRVVRLKVTGNSAAVDGTVVDNIPGGTTHDGGRLGFGPDGFLYAAAGDGRNTPNVAQSTGSLAGKILRLNPTGGAAPGNPFGNEVWSYGHRNPQGFGWDRSDRMIADEHGPSCNDEVNIIVRGGNYGWTGDTTCPNPPVPAGSIPPARNYPSIIAPSGAVFYTSATIPQWTNSYIMGALAGMEIHRLTFDAAGAVTGEEVLYDGVYGRIRSIQQAPDGTVWFTTDSGSDGIYRIRPT